MRILRFNMIEIVLAIGIAAFGITAVVAMIPPALNANRDVSADAFVDEAVSKIGTYVTLQLMYQSDWSSACPDENHKPDDVAITASPRANANDHGILGMDMWLTSTNGVYYMEASDGTPFAVKLWCNSSVSDFYNGSSTGQTLLQGVRIHAEIAWPANRATNRTIRTFCWDVFKQ